MLPRITSVQLREAITMPTETPGGKGRLGGGGADRVDQARTKKKVQEVRWGEKTGRHLLEIGVQGKGKLQGEGKG